MVVQRFTYLFLLFWSMAAGTDAQTVALIEDFEGFADHQRAFSDGTFRYGQAHIQIEQGVTTGNGLIGNRCLKVGWEPYAQNGGWGVGLGTIFPLNLAKHSFSFFSLSYSAYPVEIIIQEEDGSNGNGYTDEKDDTWHAEITLKASAGWQQVNIPLSDFKDMNEGGDGVFNASYAEGRIYTVIFNLDRTVKENQGGGDFYIDHVGFTGKKGYAVIEEPEGHCAVGAWSVEGNRAAFMEIPDSVEKRLNGRVDRQLNIVSFYKPFALDTAKFPNAVPPSDQLQNLINRGYQPMITLETRYATNDPNYRQPNLYSIQEGWFDDFFRGWAQNLKHVNGPIMLRILHEFNGNWYPWCISKNDKDYALYVSCFQRIVNLFRHEGADNVKFVWCPNSMSTPQRGWNNILNAYPGNEFVDIIGLDVFNGAGQAGIPKWQSFRKELSEQYYVLTTKFPEKPLFICETSSRERFPQEPEHVQQKDDWIRQMSWSLKHEFPEVRAITWFNQYDYFKLSSSKEAEDAFRRYVWEDSYFRYVHPLPLEP